MRCKKYRIMCAYPPFESDSDDPHAIYRQVMQPVEFDYVRRDVVPWEFTLFLIAYFPSAFLNFRITSWKTRYVYEKNVLINFGYSFKCKVEQKLCQNCIFWLSYHSLQNGKYHCPTTTNLNLTLTLIFTDFFCTV